MNAVIEFVVKITPALIVVVVLMHVSTFVFAKYVTDGLYATIRIAYMTEASAAPYWKIMITPFVETVLMVIAGVMSSQLILVVFGLCNLLISIGMKVWLRDMYTDYINASK